MKTIFRVGVVGYVLAANGMVLAAEDPVEPLVSATSVSVASKTAMHRQLARLVREDAGTFVVPEVKEERDNVAFVVADTTLQLEPMTVNGKKIVIPPPLHESPMQEFFRTGTIWEKVGPRFTRRLWIKGDRGIMFTLLW